MDAKISHFSELSNFLSKKSIVCNDFLSLLDRFKLSQSLRKLGMEKQKGASSLDLLIYRYWLLLIRRVRCRLTSHCMQRQEVGITSDLPGSNSRFGKDLMKEVRAIKDGAIHVITLLRKKDTHFTVDGKRLSATLLIHMQERKGFTTCRQYKSRYDRVKAEYDGMPVQLFIIRYGRSTHYEVIVTTDMTLSFKEA